MRHTFPFRFPFKRLLCSTLVVKYTVSTFLDVVRTFSNLTRAPVSIEAVTEDSLKYLRVYYTHTQDSFSNRFTRAPARAKTTGVREVNLLSRLVVTECLQV